MPEEAKHAHLKIKIGVSGAAETTFCGKHAFEDGKDLGKAIASNGAVCVHGATTGFPLWAAMGAKEAGGMSVGLSPASTEREHVEVYKLPIDYMDIIIYTGFGYPGRDLLFTRTCDAMVIGCGRIGTIHEFTIAFEDGKPIGILHGDWEMDDTIRIIMERGHRPNNKVIYDVDPDRLVKRLIELVEKEKNSLSVK